MSCNHDSSHAYHDVALVCDQYLHEIARLYSQACADTSIVEPDGQGRFLVSVAMTAGDGFTLPVPVVHTGEQMAAMIANLSKRKGESCQKRR